MPAIVGTIKIISVGSGAIVQFGDSIQVSPVSSSKTYAGSGSFNTGDLPVTNNLLSATNTFDPDVKDQTQDNFGVEGNVI
ncbi:spore germination protein [Chengkuizengella axinellae]|uniref:Spore germination protein n=1 Tax=Chengkuizengella axinellae TaxID=3064388 RepID=A0ABT9IUE8_9BACL|nr:spore germination protein [Chengkuizengella sp. 2205SS18-9]MDP5272504.1 spore germination protein [Chengkuizengella sp. 2205SS18-9]